MGTLSYGVCLGGCFVFAHFVWPSAVAIFLQILYEHETDCCGQLAILHMHSAFAVEYFSLSVFELLALWIRNLFFALFPRTT